MIKTNFTKPPKIGVCGPSTPHHTDMIAKALEAEVLEIGRKSTDVDVILFVFPTPDMKEYVDYCKERGILTLSYYIGTDVMRISMDWFYRQKMPTFNFNLANHQRLTTELDRIGIDAHTLLYFSPRKYAECGEPLKTVGVYLPTSTGKYCFDEVLDIASKVDLQFHVYGSDKLLLGPKEPSRNCKMLGRIEESKIAETIQSFSVLLRLTQHDGFPQNVIDAKMAKKNVIASYPYEGCFFVSTKEQAIELLKKEKTHEPDQSDWPSWYRKNCSMWNFKHKFMEFLGDYANLPRW